MLAVNFNFTLNETRIALKFGLVVFDTSFLSLSTYVYHICLSFFINLKYYFLLLQIKIPLAEGSRSQQFFN